MFTGDIEAARVLLEELHAADPNNPMYLKYLGVCAARLGERTTAEDYGSRLEEAANEADIPANWTYSRAVIEAQLGDHEEALLLLNAAVSQGFGSFMLMHSDPYLEPLRDDPGFQEILRPKG